MGAGDFLTGLVIGGANEASSARTATLARGDADIAERARDRSEDRLTDEIIRNKLWRGYAENLLANLDARKMTEDELIAELQKVDPKNALANKAAIEQIVDHHLKRIHGTPEMIDGVVARVDKDIKELEA